MGNRFSTHAKVKEVRVPGKEPHLPPQINVEQGETRLLWDERGGKALEDVLRTGSIALLNAQYLIDLADKGGILAPRQAMPDHAFLSETQVIACDENNLLLSSYRLCVSVRADAM